MQWILDRKMKLKLFFMLLCSTLLTPVVAPPKQASKVRLKGGSGPHEGHVEIYLKKTWKYICPNHWDIRDAKVICRMLNYTKAVSATSKAYFNINDHLGYWLDNVQCWGSEPDVNYCWHTKYGRHNCKDRSRLAGVVCTNITDNDIKVPVASYYSGKRGAKMKVRLNGEQSHGFISSGFLEVFYDGLWGNVCMDHWTRKDSYVACGHLGYPDIEYDVNRVPRGWRTRARRHHYWMTRVKCDGSESTLYECDHYGWRRHVCVTDRPVYLNCKRSPLLVGNRFDKALIRESTVRLRSGARHSEGRVEIKHMGRWGTICDDGWDIKAANVFCRMAGFGTAFEAVHNALFGQAVGKVWLDQIKCSGHERNITRCRHLPWGEGDCGHPEDAGVKCHFPYGKPEQQIRLHGGDEMSGRVEILDQGVWKGICGIGWDVPEAQVVCRQLGLGYPIDGYPSKKFGMSRQLGLHNVKCSGDELALHHCFHHRKAIRKCGPWMAAVNCSDTAPDLIVDYRRMKMSLRFSPQSLGELKCAYDEGCLASDASNYIHAAKYYERLLLRFTSRMYNRGTRDFKPWAAKNKWEWHSCHGHYHSMERFSDYDLTDAYGIKRAEGHKASFCLEDSICDGGVKQRFDCDNGGDQGISVACADNYKYNIDCQWVDMTTVAPGRYKLRVILNPLHKIFESDYSNNVVRCDILYTKYPVGRIDADDCYVEDCEQLSHGGTGSGGCCVFPFIYRGKQYRTCTTAGFHNHQVLWCSTTSNYDADKRWGHCRPVSQ